MRIRVLFLLGFCFLLLISCAEKQNSEDKSKEGDVPDGVPILPHDPRASLQPLSPGYSWVYRIRVEGKPKLFSWFTKDGQSGLGFAATGLFSVMDNFSPGEYIVKYTVTKERKVLLPGKDKDSFYKILVTDLESKRDLSGGETLYWGRYRYNSPMDLAIVELREIGSKAKKILTKAPFYTSDFSRNRYHFRYLSIDYLYDWPRKGRVLGGSMHLYESDIWEVNTPEEFEEIVVPAGTFTTIPTKFKFSLSGRTKNWIRETLYYSSGVGLVKWVQSERGQNTIIAELIDYDVKL